MCADAVVTATTTATASTTRATKADRVRFIGGGILCSQRRLRGSNPGDRHPVRRAADVVEPGQLEERDRLGVAAVLAADAEPDLGLRLAPDPCRQPHEPPHARLVDRLERAP